MAITPLPTPPSRDDAANFSARADEFLGALPTFAVQANALADDVAEDAQTATDKAAAASTAADRAEAAQAITGNPTVQSVTVKDTDNTAGTKTAMTFARGTGAGVKGTVETKGDGANGLAQLAWRLSSFLLTILANGKVLINKSGTGIINAGFELAADGLLFLSRSAGATLGIARLGSNGSVLEFYRDDVLVGSASVTTTATSFNTSSARELKIDDGPVSEAIAILRSVEPRMMRFKAEPDAPSCPMFFADELAAANPWSANSERADYGKQTALLWAVCRALVDRIEALEAKA